MINRKIILSVFITLAVFFAQPEIVIFELKRIN